MRYQLHTLLIILALGPPVLAGGWWVRGNWREWRDEQARVTRLRNHPLLGKGWGPPTPPVVLKGTLDELPTRPDITPP
jgi:hypothetical protein